ncbi:hypothetical protein M0812_15981 [Anaeramoeba flamelloides]|uniref:Uncharacterized protein n=1 Tax=Anaeramoeba flamelloides TaxID=1746091 RepID=A0AAV7ZI51_9EUKA|nr:hypothetical protein M0812_15981 [Anaeramoeba flamelloides]
MTKMYRMYIDLGDPSHDGHGISKKVLIEANQTVKTIREAYLKSCQETGFSFNHNNDFTGRNYSHKEKKKHCFCTEYQQDHLSKEQIIFLRENDFPYFDEFEDYDDEKEANELEVYVEEDNFISLLMWFIGMSCDDLVWNPCQNEIPTLNSGKLRVQFGYGLYD